LFNGFMDAGMSLRSRVDSEVFVRCQAPTENRPEDLWDIRRFDYDLPPGLIAQHPLDQRDQCRLMVVSRGGKDLRHTRFHRIREVLREGDLLVVNNSRVFPARLLGRKGSGGRAELLLVRPASFDARPASTVDPAHLATAEWLCLARCSGRLRCGENLQFPDGVEGEVLGRERADGNLWKVRFNREGEEFFGWVLRTGSVPLPPYIRRDPTDPALRRDGKDSLAYQTIFAKTTGSVAAPTAGFHFTESLRAELEASGIRFCEITLHVGHGTFLPIRSEDVRAHTLWPERFSVSHEAADSMRMTLQKGGRIVAVGTTVVRCLETVVSTRGALVAAEGWADLYIVPGHRFRAVDALITNFHLPRSTLLVLVAAFAGLETTARAYEEAVRMGYRFYSYGDCMLIQ